MTCNYCGHERPKSSFRIRNGNPSGRCKECRAEYMKGYWKRNPIKYAAHKGKRYGLTGEEYLSIVNGVCSICEENPVTVLDHCHDTNKVRGGLCNDCNVGLGNFRDSISRLENAIKYLGR